MDVTQEQVNVAIDLLTTIVVEDLAKEEQRDSSDVLPEFLLSHTGQMLHNEKINFGGKALLRLKRCIKKNLQQVHNT